MANPIIIDCDTGRDDAMAIWLAVKLGYNIAGIVTSFGNTNVENVTANTAGVLSFIGADHVPLLKGVSEPSSIHAGYKKIVLPRQAVSGNGICNIAFPTNRPNYQTPVSIEDFASFVRQSAKEHGKIDYIILGPATNFAKLCNHMGDEIEQVINSVTMLGGKIAELWDRYPFADFNIVCDPVAVDQVLKTNLTKKFITLESTWDISMPLADIEKLFSKGTIGQKTKEIMETFCRHFAPEPIFRFHDPSVMFLYNQADYTERSVSIELDETHKDFGRLLCNDASGYKVHICNYKDLDRDQLRNQMLNTLELFET